MDHTLALETIILINNMLHDMAKYAPLLESVEDYYLYDESQAIIKKLMKAGNVD